MLRCRKDYVITEVSQHVIYTCVTKDRKNVYVTLEGETGTTIY